MTVQAATDSLQGAGWVLEAMGGKLSAKRPMGAPHSANEDALLEVLRQNKAQAISLLEAHSSSCDFAPVVITTYDPSMLDKIKAHIDGGSLRLAGKVRIYRSDARIEVPLLPLIPPEWIDVLQEAQA